MDQYAAPASAFSQSSAPTPQLTLLTVCVRKHYDDLRRHINMLRSLNGDADWRLIIVDNSDSEGSQLEVDDPKVEVRPGIPLDLGKSPDVRFSYHHGSAINANLRDIRSRFLLVIDPDMFVVYPNWMRETIAHMLQQELHFFGTPWHPRWYTKYRYFPAVHFLLIDLRRVPLAELDFRPELVERTSWSRRYDAAVANQANAGPGPSSNAGPSKILRRVGWRLLNAAYRAGYFVFSRQLIGSSFDTGWKIWARFGRRCPAEFVLPVVDLDSDFMAPRFLTTKFGRAIDAVFPTRFRFLPKLGTYVSPAEASACDLPKLRSLGIEAFIWRKKAFAFHRRGYIREELKLPEADPAETLAWTRMLDRYGTPTAISDPSNASWRYTGNPCGKA